MRQRVFVGCNLLQVKIGNAEYNCSCVRCVSSEYVTSVTSEDVWVIVGISAGSGLCLLVIIVIIVVVVSRTRRRRDRPSNESNNVARSMDVYDNRSMTSYDYCTVPDDNDNNAYYSTGPAQPSENSAYSALDIPTYSEDEF